ncbi:MAG: hypothetical protein HFJ33_01695 [Clostridia bacterium]|nr:hypothetical protein [Clostridia bacterium]
MTLVSSGQIASPNTISSHSICKTEALMIRFAGNVPVNSLQGRSYVHTYWGQGARSICLYSELPYDHGYNPTTNNSWWNVGSHNSLYYHQKLFTQFGGHGVNLAGRTANNSNLKIPSEIAEQYLFGISSIQFKLQNSTDFSIIYQCYVNGIGWLKASSDGEENCYQYDKPISSLRINLVPISEKQRFIDYWNRAI